MSEGGRQRRRERGREGDGGRDRWREGGNEVIFLVMKMNRDVITVSMLNKSGQYITNAQINHSI